MNGKQSISNPSQTREERAERTRAEKRRKANSRKALGAADLAAASEWASRQGLYGQQHGPCAMASRQGAEVGRAHPTASPHAA